MPDQHTDSIVGAIIFFAYIAGALFFTGFISRDLAQLYSQNEHARKPKHEKPATPTKSRDKAGVFLALSLLSFSTLSYHMLKFLVVSFSTWWRVSEGSRPIPFFGGKDFTANEAGFLISNIWTWSTQSTLFQVFAQDLIRDPHHFLWTWQALLYSLGWNVYMAVEGVRYQIPHLWAYFILDQILPLSFTQNLFCVATCLTENSHDGRMLEAAPARYQIGLAIVYVLALVNVRNTLGSVSFFVLIFLVRNLLFIPYVLLKPVQTNSAITSRRSNGQLLWEYRHTAFIIAGGGALLLYQSGPFSQSVPTLLSFDNNAAAATLAYDYAIAISSLIVMFISGKVKGLTDMDF